MPINLLKKFNDLLDLSHLNKTERKQSLYRIFKRDIEDNPDLCFRGRKINPVKGSEPDMEILYKHLTTVIIDKKTRKREYEPRRSERLHWIRHYIEEKKKDNVLVFSVKEKEGIRTYIFDKDEKYVVILEPYQNRQEYYLITAYYLEGRNYKKILNKYKRRLPDVY